MTRKKLQKILKHIAYNDKVEFWTWLGFTYHLHQNNDFLAITRTRCDGKTPKLLNHEECVRALKIYKVWKNRSYAQEVLGLLFENGAQFKDNEYDYYINKHEGAKRTYYSIDRVGIKTQTITSMNDTQILNNELFKDLLGEVW